jgi:hypothetical protein
VALDSKKSPISPNRFERNRVFLFLVMKAVYSIWIFIFLQYSVKFALLKKWRFCVSHRSQGSNGITGTFPLQNSWNLEDMYIKFENPTMLARIITKTNLLRIM